MGREAMSKRELERAGVLARNQSGELKLRDAARLMGLSYRQAKRLRKKYGERGASGLKHGNAGRRSHRAIAEEQRGKMLALVREHYSGGIGERFGPTLAAEHLAEEHGYEVHAETLRRWMLSAGLWSRARKRTPYRKQRERRAHFGELIQMDGSHHGWLEERGERGCLMNMVDDATGQAAMALEGGETIWGAARILRRWVERYGVPLALYVDWKNIYVRPGRAEEKLRGEEPETQFGRMCRELGISIITANSPQAKGRVERAHGTHQDRLVKKLRVKKICSYEAANQYLEQEYVEEHNERFGREPRAEQDYHRAAPSRRELDQIFRLEQQRSVSQDWVVRYGPRSFQLQRQSGVYAPARSKVTVCEWEDGRLAIEYRGQKMKWEEITTRSPMKPKKEKAAQSGPTQGEPRRRGNVIPGVDHPWRRKAVPWEERKAIRRWRDSSLATAPSSATP